MNTESKRIEREAVVPVSRYLPDGTGKQENNMKPQPDQSVSWARFELGIS
jgi:hypothetical protein